MAGFGMVIAGAAKGLGTGIVEQARAKREMMMKMLDEQTADRRIGEERAFRSSEADKDRAFRSEEGQKARDANVEYGTSETGETVAIRGTKAEPVTGADGKPVKLARTKDQDSDPAEVKTAEWLVRQGVAKDAGEAWGLVRRARENPEGSRAAIFKAWMTALKPEFGNVDGAKLQEEASRRTEETLRFLDGDETSVQDVQAPPAPRDPEKRTVGQVYTAPDGRKIEWTGEGWKVVE